MCKTAKRATQRLEEASVRRVASIPDVARWLAAACRWRRTAAAWMIAAYDTPWMTATVDSVVKERFVGALKVTLRWLHEGRATLQYPWRIDTSAGRMDARAIASSLPSGRLAHAARAIVWVFDVAELSNDTLRANIRRRSEAAADRALWEHANTLWHHATVRLPSNSVLADILCAASTGPVPLAWLWFHDPPRFHAALPERLAAGDQSAVLYVVPKLRGDLSVNLYQLWCAGSPDAAPAMLAAALAQGVISSSP